MHPFHSLLPEHLFYRATLLLGIPRGRWGRNATFDPGTVVSYR